MSRELRERNQLITKLYADDNQSVEALASRFGISKRRIWQIIQDYLTENQRIKIMSARFTEHIPVTKVTPEMKAQIEALRKELGVSYSVLARWGFEKVLEEHKDRLEEKETDS